MYFKMYVYSMFIILISVNYSIMMVLIRNGIYSLFLS